MKPKQRRHNEIKRLLREIATDETLDLLDRLTELELLDKMVYNWKVDLEIQLDATNK